MDDRLAGENTAKMPLAAFWPAAFFPRCFDGGVLVGGVLSWPHLSYQSWQSCLRKIWRFSFSINLCTIVPRKNTKLAISITERFCLDNRTNCLDNRTYLINRTKKRSVIKVCLVTSLDNRTDVRLSRYYCIHDYETGVEYFIVFITFAFMGMILDCR